MRPFQKALNQARVKWERNIEVNSLELVERYVADGYGYGLTVAVPGATLHPAVRALPLPGFQPVEVGAVWAGKLTAIGQEFLDKLVTYARELSSERPLEKLIPCWNFF